MDKRKFTQELISNIKESSLDIDVLFEKAVWLKYREMINNKVPHEDRERIFKEKFEEELYNWHPKKTDNQ